MCVCVCVVSRRMVKPAFSGPLSMSIFKLYVAIFSSSGCAGWLKACAKQRQSYRQKDDLVYLH